MILLHSYIHRSGRIRSINACISGSSWTSGCLSAMILSSLWSAGCQNLRILLANTTHESCSSYNSRKSLWRTLRGRWLGLVFDLSYLLYLIFFYRLAHWSISCDSSREASPGFRFRIRILRSCFSMAQSLRPISSWCISIREWLDEGIFRHG